MHRGFLVITGGPGEEVRVRWVANGKQGSEDPWQDIAGYGLLGAGE